MGRYAPTLNGIDQNSLQYLHAFDISLKIRSRFLSVCSRYARHKILTKLVLGRVENKDESFAIQTW